MDDLTLIAASGIALPAQPFQARHLIGGAWRDSADGAVSERMSPAHGVVVSRAAKGGVIEVDAAVAAAKAAFAAWSRLPGKARAAVLLKVADLIEANVERMAVLETLETGKPISQSRGEVSGAADLWRYAAALGRVSHGDTHNALGEEMLAVVLKEPRGVVSVICPWNFPIWILSQKLPFALAAGCTCVVKPSELTPSTTVMLGELLALAGLPAGVVNIVLGYGEPVGSRMVQHPDVDMVTFTGSTVVGRAIAAAAGSGLKKVALELGGKNPQVVFPDADLDCAADAVVFGVYFNAGECCNSGSKVIVHADVAEAFVARVVALSRKVAFGDPLNETTQVGAIVTPAHGRKIDGYVQAAVRAGASLALGGGALQVQGLAGDFYQPTVVTGVTPDMAIAREEVFGPVLAVLTFRDLDEAITLANDASYGLSAGVWTDKGSRIFKMAAKLRAGVVWANTFNKFDPASPFGGYKESGFGREGGVQGLASYVTF